MNDPSNKAIKKQKINLMLAVAFIAIAIFGLGKFIFHNYRAPSYELFEPKMDLPVDEFKSKEVWMDRLEAQVNFLTQKQQYYEDTLLEYKERDRLNEQEKIELKRHLANIRKEMETSSERILQVENEKKPIFDEEPVYKYVSNEKSNIYESNFSSPFVSSNSYEQSQPEIIPLKPPLREYTIGSEEKNEAFSIDKRVPSNVSVKAILISSVDAVCRIDAQSDPVPVKLRLLDDGHLPGGVTVNLKGCLLGASAYGDISSERVYIRLENLTKVHPSRKAIETEVTGYVSGEDGKFGMRGVVVDRSAKILKPALGSGILSGIAQTLQSAYTRPQKETINAYTVGSDFAQNSAAGTADAFSMLASYYIRRAEQVQPVLQIDAGRIVDVTFTQGFSMGDTHAKSDLKKIREKSRAR